MNATSARSSRVQLVEEELERRHGALALIGQSHAHRRAEDDWVVGRTGREALADVADGGNLRVPGRLELPLVVGGVAAVHRADPLEGGAAAGDRVAVVDTIVD